MRSALESRIKMIVRAILAALALVSVLGGPASAGAFDNWAALVVAGDSRAHDGAESLVFDNARRDLVKALKQMGFAENHIQQYSARPDLDPVTKPLRVRTGPRSIRVSKSSPTPRRAGALSISPPMARHWVL